MERVLAENFKTRKCKIEILKNSGHYICVQKKKACLGNELQQLKNRRRQK